MFVRFFSALLVLGALAAFIGGGGTSASFSDRVTNGTNTFTNAALPAPTLNVPLVTGFGASATVALSWNNPSAPAGDFANNWDVLRLPGTCGTPSAPIQNRVTNSYTDMPGAAGDYCYAIVGKFQNWVSPLSNTKQVTVSKAITSISTTPNPSSGLLGVVLNDSATLSGGVNPTGTITFKLYPPSDASCTGTPALTQVVSVVGNNTYSTSPGFASNAAGTWRWSAVYSGDGNNNGASSLCGEPVAISNPPPPSSNLFLNMTAGTTLVTSGASGTITLNPRGGSATWNTPAATVKPTSSSGWTVTLNITGPSNFESASLQFDLWYTSTTCSTMPATNAATYIAGLAADDNDANVDAPLGAKTFTLNANASFVAPTTNQTLCLAITNIYNNNGASHRAEITAGANSKVTGPF